MQIVSQSNMQKIYSLPDCTLTKIVSELWNRWIKISTWIDLFLFWVSSSEFLYPSLDLGLVAKMSRKKWYITRKIAVKVRFLLQHLGKFWRRGLQTIKEIVDRKSSFFDHLILSKPLQANSAGSMELVHNN